MLRVVIVFGILAAIGGVATWRPDLAEQAYQRVQQIIHPPPPASFGAVRRQQGGPPVAVALARADKRDMPIVIEAVGTVQAIASLQIKARLDTQVVQVHVAEGASVKEGDLLFTLDDRVLRAQIAQIEAQILRTRAQLEQATRDRERLVDLARRNVATDVARDNAITNVKAVEAQLAADEANRESLRTQLSYTRITAPITGRIGSIAAKPGAFVRPADTAAMTTINQLDPIYIAFAMPQATFYELRSLLGGSPQDIRVEATAGGKSATGVIAFVENQVDLATGTVTAKARMENGAEQLWPGSFVPVKVTLGMQPNAIVVPASAMQAGQNGPFVFTVSDGVAQVVSVQVARRLGDEVIIASGLNGGEQVVTSGQLRIVQGSRVIDRTRAPGTASGEPAARGGQS
ncbi:efflux RND transporter periplasmic adaptor subunit [Phreatobacter sp.]|uniref:efflux RND transporter periplasmic adaptor subunit n=1 Tax=Phreatobacter sp. TaxID=1966341 RepID=UPI003F71A829